MVFFIFSVFVKNELILVGKRMPERVEPGVAARRWVGVVASLDTALAGIARFDTALAGIACRGCSENRVEIVVIGYTTVEEVVVASLILSRSNRRNSSESSVIRGVDISFEILDPGTILGTTTEHGSGGILGTKQLFETESGGFVARIFTLFVQGTVVEVRRLVGQLLSPFQKEEQYYEDSDKNRSTDGAYQPTNQLGVFLCCGPCVVVLNRNIGFYSDY